MQQLFDLIQQKSPGAKPLLIVIRGSHAYGTALPTSDTDYAGVYIQPMEDILGFKYKDQINDDKNDTVFYELKRFLELVRSNNPNILELLNTPEDCIIYKDPVFDEILKHKNDFITKTCAKSFAGYAVQQIKKAKGQDKKQNWEKDKVTRKTPLDFCYFHFGSNSVPLTTYLNDKGMDQKFCGLSKVPHSRDTYALHYDIGAEENNDSPNFGFRGIAFEDSNDVRLSSIPKEATPCFIGYVSYNKDGYTTHCDDYRSYETWLQNRNEQRCVDVKSHGQRIDGKNMMHCRRLLEMSREIAEGKGINVRRSNADYLISIRKGEVDLQTLIDAAEKDIKEIDVLFESSNLPNEVSLELVNQILVNIRKQIYKI
jgi:uncharacterized protein